MIHIVHFSNPICDDFMICCNPCVFMRLFVLLYRLTLKSGAVGETDKIVSLFTVYYVVLLLGNIIRMYKAIYVYVMSIAHVVQLNGYS